MSKKYVQKCSTFLVIRLKQPRETTSYQSKWLRLKTQVIAGAGEDVEKEELLLHCWWNCKLVQPLWKSVWRLLRKLDIVLPENPALPFLGIYPEDAPACNKDTCSIM